MTAKHWLRQLWTIDRSIDARTEELERLRARAEGLGSPKLTGMPGGGSADWADLVARIVALEDEIRDEVTALCALKREINDAIDAVADERLRTLLELRYRARMTWEQIAQEMHYDVRWVYHLHGLALQQIKVPGGDAAGDRDA